MMFRVRSPSLASVRRGSNHTRTKCFGIISSRTATLCLALIGILAHLQTFRHLEILYDSFPNVPKTRNTELNKNEMMTIMMMTDNGSVNRFNSNTIKPSEPANVVLDSEFNFVEPVSNTWTPSTSTSTTSTEDALEMVKPTKWFNLLPKRPWGEGKSSPEQDEERKSWEAAKILTIMMKIYSITSIIACLIGVHGVIRSNLFSTRIFILSSLIDVFFFALSVMSICIIITYPEIRSMLCEQISSGELHSLLNYMRGSNSSSMSSLSSSSSLAINQQNSQEPSIVALSQPPASVLPAANFISKSASSFWARTLESSKSLDENSSTRTYWWDTLLDDMLENESCDDIFVSVLVPIGLMICLVYLVFRIHFLFVIRSYYVSLVRQKMGFYLESSSSDTSKTSSKENLSTINEKFSDHV